MITIITPSYNRASLISRMIRSVINQTYEKWELIIIDDGSTDNTKEIVKAFEDKRVKYFYTENSGAADSRNVGVTYAQSEYIIFLDSDDEAKKQWLEKLALKIETRENSIVCCGIEKYNSKGELEKVELPQSLGSHFNNIVASFLSGTMLLKKELFVKSGGYDINLPSGQHTELFMRLFPLIIKNKIEIVNVFEALIKVHIHGGNRIRHNYEAIFLGSKGILKKQQNFFQKNKQIHFDYLSMAAVSAFKTNRIGEGKKFLIKAMTIKPLDYRSYARLIIGFTPFIRTFVWKKKL